MTDEMFDSILILPEETKDEYFDRRWRFYHDLGMNPDDSATRAQLDVDNLRDLTAGIQNYTDEVPILYQDFQGNRITTRKTEKGDLLIAISGKYIYVNKNEVEEFIQMLTRIALKEGT